MSDEFFKMVAEAAFSNPFGEKRAEIDRRIVGASESTEWQSTLPPLLRDLAKQIQSLEQAGELVVDIEAEGEARNVTVSVLFHVFHRYMEAFDALIEEQLASGDESCRAPFAFQCLEDLAGYGFKRADACRYVGIFYQIRRAFYFISTELIGESPCMRQMRAQLWDNIFTHDIAWYVQCLWNRMEDFSTLLLGETGTGKGAAAAAIGRSGYIPFNPNAQKFEESFTRAFVSINLSQYPETLIESELFGHRKGAFTGAIEKHDGIFSRCSPCGAIFLDEIGDVSIPVQIKLLQVLQERTFSPVGSHDKLRFKGRVIAATNKSIDALRREGTFRDDFYYRLCSDLITMPPLRQRIRETPRALDQLAGHLAQRICGEGEILPILGKLNQDVGKNYAWPGNVRELEQAIRRILLTGAYAGDSATEPTEEIALSQAVEAGNLTAKELVEHYCRDLYTLYGNYGEVARRTGLDWRTVKKNVTSA
ncbi:sigma-54-dependent transcriptional regulator [Pontiella sulfatireligans]|uniref:Nitrogen assimilation regulatory protein n=1 Tax=Pontiella sulfatireligans TaxID=2750658 RepID=A0A6C2UER7_9BACT|nr:sigma 54-interacting transcriptional regulator [Pontiella sulfatireligans]VGO18409.1 Nitrogen assimilation regulatory protein [Pontiella sulfatireligans]